MPQTRYLRYRYDGTARVLRRRGRPPFTPSTADAFTLGVTEPTALNTGVLPLVARTRYTGPTVIDGYATKALADANPYRDLNVDRLVTIRSGYTTWYNCHFSGSGATFDTALIDGRGAGHLGTSLERCTFDPATPSPYLNAAIGHHLTIHRCHSRRTTDFIGLYNQYSSRLDSAVTGNYLESLAYFQAAVPGVVHPSDTRTHNDGIQVQGGLGVTVRGNALHGYNLHADGSVPVEEDGVEWRLASQGVLIQENVPFPAGSTTYYGGEATVADNWLYGFMHPFSFKTRSTNGSPFDVALTGNRLMNDDQRYYGTTPLPGTTTPGRPYMVRTGTQTTVNGVTTVPADGQPYPVTGGNLYANSTAVTRAGLRGQPITIRRDNFPGG